MHHCIADAPWSDVAVLKTIIDCTLAVTGMIDTIEACIIDDSGLSQK
jgi:hypothetical protein